MTVRIHVSLPDEHADRIGALLRAALPDAEIDAGGEAQSASDALGADYIVSGHRDAALFDRQRRMKAIFTLSAGVGHLLSLPNLPRDVPLIRLEDAGMAGQMVRYVLAATLRVSQRFDRYARQQRERIWEQLEPRSPKDMTVGVLGLGVIGTQIADALAAQGFAVRGFARTPKSVSGVQCMSGDGFEVFVAGLAQLPLKFLLEHRAERRNHAQGFL